MDRQEALKILSEANVDFDVERDGAPVAPEDRVKIINWVKYLRSGKYQQGTSSLYNSDDYTPGRFCCLGVYCHAISGIDTGFLECEELPKDIDVKLPISLEAQETLAAINDGYRRRRYINSRPFSEIADIIEAVFL